MINCNRFVNTWFTSNTYILSHSQYENIWIVDPGDVQPIINWIDRNGKKTVSGILLTHAHFDHIYGVNDILNLYPQCIVYTANEYGKELLGDAKKNSSRYSELGPITIKELAQVSFFKSEMTLWKDVLMKVYITPGHSDDSVCLQIDNMLFTGDTLIKDVRTVTKLKGGSVEKLKETIRLLSSLKGKGLTIHAGHEDSFLLDNYNLEKAFFKRI